MLKKIKLCFLYYENRLKLTLKQQLGILPSNFCQTLSKKVKLSASHAMLPKPMQSCPTVSVKCLDQDCIRLTLNETLQPLLFPLKCIP